MDERDKEWLDKNNEEARGEGTSIQGAVSVSGTRTSARSAKAKGKEPDVSQPVVISEDEFELVMGLYEKITHEKYEFLHHVGHILYLLAVHIHNLMNSFRVGKMGCHSRRSQTTRTHSQTIYLHQYSPPSSYHLGSLSPLSCYG